MTDWLSLTGDPRGAVSARRGPEPRLDTVAPRFRVHLRVQTLQGILWGQGEQRGSAWTFNTLILSTLTPWN